MKVLPICSRPQSSMLLLLASYGWCRMKDPHCHAAQGSSSSGLRVEQHGNMAVLLSMSASTSQCVYGLQLRDHMLTGQA